MVSIYQYMSKPSRALIVEAEGPVCEMRHVYCGLTCSNHVADCMCRVPYLGMLVAITQMRVLKVRCFWANPWYVPVGHEASGEGIVRHCADTMVLNVCT